MLLIDLNQIVIADITVMKQSEVTENLIRHMVLNSLRNYCQQFKSAYPEIVICADAKNSWRYDFFPYYKSVRKQTQASSLIDWSFIHGSIAKIRTELQESFLHKVLHVDRAEADDIIAVLAIQCPDPVCIVSSDKDFLQLQWKPNLKQWSPRHKAFLSCEDPTGFLREHIIRGDRSDGIPNILSDDTSFVFQTRQKVLTQTRYNALQEKLVQKDYSEIEANYIRNRTLIDLEAIPEDVKASIIEAYGSARKGTKQELMDYFVKHRMSRLLEDITDY